MGKLSLNYFNETNDEKHKQQQQQKRKKKEKNPRYFGQAQAKLA